MPRKNIKNYVEFYINPNTSDKNVERVLKIVNLFCDENRGVCILPDKIYPIKIEMSSDDDEDLYDEDDHDICLNGWLNVYEFKSTKDAVEFADYISLLRPICDITFVGGRFTGKPKLKK